MQMSPETRVWLLDGDPAVSWQVQRDLLDAPESTWAPLRRQVAETGWGARLLSLRADDGTWGGGLYQPKWTGTFYTLRLLIHLGIEPLHPAAQQSCLLLLDRGVTASGAVSLWNSGTTDMCVTAMLLDMACALGLGADERCARMATWLMEQQMHDGGWNCSQPRSGATHASFHTTISTLEGLTAFADATGQSVTEATNRGRAFFLDHQLYRSSTTGAVIRSSFAQLFFPAQWYFDILRGLEHFAAVGEPWDECLADPLAVLHQKRRKGGWTASQHTEPVHFRLETPRRPSRINTLRALRVLRWEGGVRGV